MRFQYAIRRNSPTEEQRDRELEDYLASLQPTPWTAVAFQNSWVNFGSSGGVPNLAAMYRKKGDMTQVRGLVKSGASGSIAFTLPEGFRPPETVHLASVDATSPPTVALIRINAQGEVAIFASVITAISVEFEYSVTA